MTTLPTDPPPAPPPALGLAITKTTMLSDPYVVAGDRAYLIGAQDGSFPDVGHHVPGEMWGLWPHPHKLLDGYWCAMRPADPSPLGDRVWLGSAQECTVEPLAVRQRYDLPDLGLRVERCQWVPEGQQALVVEWTLEDRGGGPPRMELTVAARADLRPGWLQEAPDGADVATFDDGAGAWVMHDPVGGWALAWGAAYAPVGHAAGEAAAPVVTAGRGCGAALTYLLEVPRGGRTTLSLAFFGAAEGPAEALRGLAALLAARPEHYAAKARLYASVLERSRLDLPDPTLMRAWDWVKCNYRWLERDVPGVGRGLGAGLPEYPWWFGCDAAYALRGLLPLGGFETAAVTLRLLAAASERHNGASGRIIHELAGSGIVYNPGNTQETPQFTTAVWETYLWTGDEALLRDLYPLCCRGVLEWTLGTMDSDGDLLPEGYGITEVAGLDAELLDSAVWAAAAVQALGEMAARVGDSATAARCAELAPRLRATVVARFWLPDQGIFADVVATPRRLLARLAAVEGQYREQQVPRLRDHLRLVAERARALPPDEEVPWYLGHWIVLAPLELGLASREQAAQAFGLLESAAFSGPHGIYLSAMVRGASMSISTGALAAAEVAYGRLERALAYARQIASSLDLHMPGAISEMSPDGGCFVQAWSGYGVVHPVTAGVFGVAPDAARRRLVLRPRLPDGWPRAALRGLRVGTATFDIVVERAAAGASHASVQASEPGWDMEILS